MWKKAICVLLCITNPIESYAKIARSISVEDNQVVPINTALGYSTILEFSSKPVSAVLGDQDAFKLEYVGSSITIKPLIPGAKTNLFVFTNYDRFSCSLRTGNASTVDYIVRLSKKTAPPEEFERKIGKSASLNGFNLKLLSVAKDEKEFVISFELSTRLRNYTFSPGALGVKQFGKFISIDSIYFDDLTLEIDGAPVRGKFVLSDSDFKSNSPITVIFSIPIKNKTSRIEITLQLPKRTNK